MKTQVYRTLENNVQIIEYHESHAKSLAQMFNDSKEFWLGDSTVHTEDSMKSMVEREGNINAYLAVVEHDEVIGYCGLSPSVNDVDSFYINLLGVRPDYHGKGIGKALVDLAIKRTTELGKKRVDIHTWAGNTGAMPLYKKMGFFWEDHDDIHLTNFMPFVVTHPLFKAFFVNDQWDKFSTRVIDTKPCGVKINTFEMFEYSFENGDEILKVGFEKSGKQVRLIETNDYKIEFLANKHKLAFGLNYPATFHIENKSDKKLEINIQGKTDENITHECQFNEQITGITKHETTFFVGEIKDTLAEEKVHPCVRADVTINGQTIEFGLGINTKFPLESKFVKKTRLSRVGAKEKVYINVKNLLLEDATVAFSLPTSEQISFSKTDITLQVPTNGYGSIALDAHILKQGYIALPITYHITPKNGTTFVYEKELHIELQGFSAKYHYEDEKMYIVANGPWSLHMYKDSNCALVKHVIHGDSVWLSNPILGKPYIDEFENIKPASVVVEEVGEEMVLIYELHSKAFEGIVVKQITRIGASGYISQKYLIENIALTTQDIVLRIPCYTYFTGKESVFAKGDHLTTNHGSMLRGSLAVEQKDFTENWIFEQHKSAGACWSKDFTAELKWGGSIQLDKDFVEMETGKVYETGEIEFIIGTFEKAAHFRDYVLEKYSDHHPLVKPFIGLQTQTENPFVYEHDFGLDVINNRNSILKGTFALSSENELFKTQSWEQLAEEVIEKHRFNVEVEKYPCDGIGKFRLDLDVEDYEFTRRQAVFLPKGQVDCHEEGGIWSVKNDKIAFKADPAYSDGIFSLLYLDQNEEHEWLMHKYPKHVPYGIWNPFFGGIWPRLGEINERRILKEQKIAEFIEIKDNFNNSWIGLKMVVEVKEHEDEKGMLYENYFVTLPGLPLLCHFSKIHNHTGAFKNVDFCLDIFPNGAENLVDNKVSYRGNEHVKRSLNMGIVDQYESHKSPLSKLSSKRSEKLYVYQDTNESSSEFEGTNEYIELFKYYNIKMAHEEVHTTSPVFMILSEKDFVEEELADLEKIRFD